MTYKIKYATQAIRELDDIFEFIAKVSLTGAKNVVNHIRTKVKTLSFMLSGFDFDARIGRKLHDTYKTQAFISDNYLILFVVDDEEKSVIITHFIPSKSNYMKLLRK